MGVSFGFYSKNGGFPVGYDAKKYAFYDRLLRKLNGLEYSVDSERWYPVYKKVKRNHDLAFDKGLSVDLSCSSARFVLDHAGIDTSQLSGSMHIDAFIKIAIRVVNGQESEAVMPSEESSVMVKRDENGKAIGIGRGCTMIGGGKREGFANDVFMALYKNALEAKTLGAEYVAWA